MLDKRSSLCGIVILVSLFFVPNSAFATVAGPLDFVPGLSYLISIVVVPLAFVYLGIVSLKHFNPNLGNYIHSNRLLKIGFYFLAEGLTWVIFHAITIQDWSDLQYYYLWPLFDFFMLLVIPAILLISIGVTKNRLSNIPRLGIIFLAGGISWVSFYVYSSFGHLFDSVLSILIIIPPAILFFSIGVILIIKHYIVNKKLINS